MLITKQIEVDVSHEVPNHKGKCKNLHGHRFCIEVGVDDIVLDSKGDSSEGMVIDFGDLKELMMEIIDKRLDHTGIYWTDDPDMDLLLQKERRQIERGGKPMIWLSVPPTAENIAKYLYKEMKPALIGRNIKIKYVKVFETPTSSATYFENVVIYFPYYSK